MRKIFVSGFILASACLLAGNQTAHAGVLNSCMKWLTAPPPERPIAKAYQAYEHFLKMRKENPKTVPPAFPVTKTTSKEDMFFNFTYWWLPGNIWHNLISSEHSGAEMLEEFKSAGGRIPDYTEMPEPSTKDASLNIPTLLPDSTARVVSKKFKRQAKKDYKIYLQMRERDPRVNPPTSKATKDTSHEELFFGFPYWWYPANVWHQLMSSEKEHGDLAASIYQGHVDSGFDFPDLSEAPIDNSFEVPDSHPDIDSANSNNNMDGGPSDSN